MTSLWFRSALLPEGWAHGVRIEIDRGVISQIAVDTVPSSEDEHHATGLPGLPNLHSHAFQRGMAGLAEIPGPHDNSFWTWREMMYRFLDRLNPDDVQAIAAQAYVEMLESGFTRVGEFHYVHHDHDGKQYSDIAELGCRIAAATQETGIALTLLPVFYAHGGFGSAEPSHGQRRFLNDVDRFAKLMQGSAQTIAALDDAVLGLAPHSLRAATADEINSILSLTDGPIHIHVAEQTKEVDDCLAWCGRRPVERLFDTTAVDARWCLIHATHASDAEVANIAASGAIVGLCPVTEANLGDGIFPAGLYTAAGGRFGIGSDSNVLIDAAQELRCLEYSQRLWHRARNVLSRESTSTGRALFDAALTGGALALGVSCDLSEGSPADIVSLDERQPSLLERDGDGLLDGWIFACRTGAVDCVWRRGKKVVVVGQHVAREAVLLRFKSALRNLLV